MRSKRKFNKTREWVIEEYVNKNRSRKEVAEECGLTIGGFKSYLLEQKTFRFWYTFTLYFFNSYLIY